MKNMITFFTVTICLVLVVLTILTLNNYQTRKNEIEETLAGALDQAIENLKLEEYQYSPEEYENFVSDLLQQILLRINSDCDVKINVLNVELDSGVVDLEVIEYYKWMGQKKEITERRTVVLEEYKKEEDVDTDAIASQEGEKRFINVQFIANDISYTTLSVVYGEPIAKPTDPVAVNYKFVGWYIQGDASREVLDDSDWEYLCPSEDIVFVAKFVAA